MQLGRNLGGGSGGRRRRVAAEVRRRCAFVEFEVFAEHPQQVLLETHHQWMNPGVKEHICALKTHLRGITCGEILDVNRGRNHRAGHSQTLRDVALHLRPQYEFGLQLGDPCFNVEVVVGDQCFETIQLGRFANFAGKLAAVGAQSNDGETEFTGGKSSRRDRMAGVPENKHAFTSQVGRVDRPGVPGCPRGVARQERFRIHVGKCSHLTDKVNRGPDADRNDVRHGLFEIAR